MMNVEIRRQGIELSDDQRNLLTTRVSDSVERFEQHIESLAVTVSDENGPKAGPDKRCRIQANVRGGKHLIVEEVGADLEAVLGAACDRFASTVRRDLERRNDHAHLPMNGET